MHTTDDARLVVTDGFFSSSGQGTYVNYPAVSTSTLLQLVRCRWLFEDKAYYTYCWVVFFGLPYASRPHYRFFYRFDAVVVICNSPDTPCSDLPSKCRWFIGIVWPAGFMAVSAVDLLLCVFGRSLVMFDQVTPSSSSMGTTGVSYIACSTEEGFSAML